MNTERVNSKAILITGGTGFLGSTLIRSLMAQSHTITVLSRSSEKVSRIFGGAVQTITDLNQLNENVHFDVIINLAGAAIFDHRWTEARKAILRSSRLVLTERLVQLIAKMHDKPELLISGSAIGIYGNQGDTELTEQSPGNPDFSQKLCADWESAAQKAEAFDVRVCLIRTGLVLEKSGGMLQRLLLPFRIGLGGKIGDGQQWMSWIHRQDWVAIVETMIHDPSMHGAYNATSPNPVTNLDFTKSLANALNRPTLLPLPAFLLKAGLGEMSDLLLGSQRVLPERLLAQGFKFQFINLDSALQEILATTQDVTDNIPKQ